MIHQRNVTVMDTTNHATVEYARLLVTGGVLYVSVSFLAMELD